MWKKVKKMWKKCKKKGKKKKDEKEGKRGKSCEKSEKDVNKCKKKASDTLIPINWLKSAIPISLHNFCQLGQHLFQVQTLTKKKKCGRPSAISVTSV